ncbi:hypothetical protein I6F35_03065 [Bradyrhizobium sp. BRP22]|uniref:hypothetical protein n=1 Tax=Bradyrhizobium sp. BRP22 TaxID=2793821 RepID=UPI001CD564A7|nr:hypothetical protein [Bradyrhizobium sp. BRP22]MCA1452196.1 hypothetical protein [Bradyrhizobium sp. BRP22]
MTTDEKTTKKEALCFVVGPIGKEGTPERKHADLLLNAIIKHVLENNEFGYKVRRADEDADPGMIGDRVIADITRSPLVIADLTDLNPNAFYELGIRHATELPTIHIARSGTPLPFDNVAHRTIFVDLTDWQSIEQARSRLADSARAIAKPDYRVSNPITQANASFKMRQSEDPRERLLAELQERLVSIESALAQSSRRQSSKLWDDTKNREKIRDRVSDEIIEIASAERKNGRSSDEILALLNTHIFEETPTDIRLDGNNISISYPGVSYSSNLVD